MAPEDTGTVASGRMVRVITLNLLSLCTVLRSRTWTGQSCCGGATLCHPSSIPAPHRGPRTLPFCLRHVPCGCHICSQRGWGMHPRSPPLSAPFGCPDGGEGRERLKHLPSTAWGRMSQFKPGVAVVGSHVNLRLTRVGLAPRVSSLGPCLAGLPSPRGRQGARLTQTGPCCDHTHSAPQEPAAHGQSRPHAGP